jgi:hypothetical protein
MGRIWNKIKNGFKKAGKFIGGVAKKTAKTMVSWSAKGANLINKIPGASHVINKVPGLGHVVRGVGAVTNHLNNKYNGGKGPIDTLRSKD